MKNKSYQQTCVVCGKEFLDMSCNHTACFCSSRCKNYYHYHKDIDKSRNKFRKWREENREREIKRARDYHIYKKETDPNYIERRRENAKKNRLANPLKVWQRHDKEHFKGNKINALKRDNYRCQVCNYTAKDIFDRKIIIHHLDGNRKNNKLDNLITLCRSCHMAITNLQHFLYFLNKFPQKRKLIKKLVKSLGEDIVRTIQ